MILCCSARGIFAKVRRKSLLNSMSRTESCSRKLKAWRGKRASEGKRGPQLRLDRPYRHQDPRQEQKALAMRMRTPCWHGPESSSSITNRTMEEDCQENRRECLHPGLQARLAIRGQEIRA